MHCGRFLVRSKGRRAWQVTWPRVSGTSLPLVSFRQASNKDGVESSRGEKVADYFEFDKAKTKKICAELRTRTGVRSVLSELNLTSKRCTALFNSFAQILVNPQELKEHPELYQVLVSLHRGEGHIDDLCPYLVQHSYTVYPSITLLPQLKKMSDLTSPPEWYLAARAIKRKFIYHAGPTNSGKTYNALQDFLAAPTGIYCAPLRLLANEVYCYSNSVGTICDLLTGEERSFGSGSPDNPSGHIACTMEMTKIEMGQLYHVAVIDEIQMIADPERGGAWTRAILGVPAKVIHVCGEPTGIPLVERLVEACNDTIEVKNYERLSPLQVSNKTLRGSFKNLRSGDCVVAFSKKKIFKIQSMIKEAVGVHCSIVYGNLPAVTRKQQAEDFNRPSSLKKVLVASDAIGMGLNLNIKRVIFYELIKFSGEEKQELSPMQVRQIGGRAGRYGKQSKGEVTTFSENDFAKLKSLMSTPFAPIEKAGLSPSFEQIEAYSAYLPGSSLREILEVFVQTACVDKNYFLCIKNVKKQIEIARSISKYKLPLRDEFIMSVSPVDPRKLVVLDAFLGYVKYMASDKPITESVVMKILRWPFRKPRNVNELTRVEQAHISIDLYLWLSHRYPHYFPDAAEVCELQKKMERIIEEAIRRPMIGMTSNPMDITPTRSLSRFLHFITPTNNNHSN